MVAPDVSFSKGVNGEAIQVFYWAIPKTVPCHSWNSFGFGIDGKQKKFYLNQTLYQLVLQSKMSALSLKLQDHVKLRNPIKAKMCLKLPRHEDFSVYIDIEVLLLAHRESFRVAGQNNIYSPWCWSGSVRNGGRESAGTGRVGHLEEIWNIWRDKVVDGFQNEFCTQSNGLLGANEVGGEWGWCSEKEF